MQCQSLVLRTCAPALGCTLSMAVSTAAARAFAIALALSVPVACAALALALAPPLSLGTPVSVSILLALPVALLFLLRRDKLAALSELAGDGKVALPHLRAHRQLLVHDAQPQPLALQLQSVLPAQRVLRILFGAEVGKGKRLQLALLETVVEQFEPGPADAEEVGAVREPREELVLGERAVGGQSALHHHLVTVHEVGAQQTLRL